MARLTYVLSAGMVLLALGCGESSRESSPTSPEFAPNSTGCDLSTARGLVNTVFPTSARQTANNAAAGDSERRGSGTAVATDAGFDLFALIAANRPVPPAESSTFINAIIPCQKVGSLVLPIRFNEALGPDGAFEVRGGSATDDLAVVSHGEVVWGLEPLPYIDSEGNPVRYTWDEITVAPNVIPTQRFLAYGAPLDVDPTAFTNEVLVGTVFDWSTVPKLTFVPGVLVGTCFTDGTPEQFLIQHHSKSEAGGAEIVPSATPSFCTSGSASLNTGWSLFALARRVFNVFKPQPLLAAALGTRPPGGAVGALSPHGAVNPKQITLSFGGNIVADGRTGQVIKFVGGDFISVSVTPTGETKMDGVLVRLIATTNLGATVVATGNEAFTADGFATFPNLKINKAGGYRLIATIGRVWTEQHGGIRLR